MKCLTDLYWLPGDRIDRTRRPHLEFIQNHMSKTLVIDYPKVDVGGEFLPCDARVHWLVSVIVVARCQELFSKVIDGGVFFGEPTFRICALASRTRYEGKGGQTNLKGAAS